MPIPFSDADDLGGLGSAAYLKLEPSPDHACCLGALLVISARGEPLEFGYNRVRVPNPFLWREVDLRRYVQRRLATSLLSVCSQQPRLLLYLADEVNITLFGHDLLLELPVVQVAPPTTRVRRVDPTTGEVLEEEEDPAPPVAWHPGPPDAGSVERQLFDHLSIHGLLREPFQRASTGLREVYGPAGCQA